MSVRKSRQGESQSSCNLISEVTSCFSYIVFLEVSHKVSAHIQVRRLPKGINIRVGITGDHPRGFLPKSFPKLTPKLLLLCMVMEDLNRNMTFLLDLSSAMLFSGKPGV